MSDRVEFYLCGDGERHLLEQAKIHPHVQVEFPDGEIVTIMPALDDKTGMEIHVNHPSDSAGDRVQMVVIPIHSTAIQIRSEKL